MEILLSDWLDAEAKRSYIIQLKMCMQSAYNYIFSLFFNLDQTKMQDLVFGHQVFISGSMKNIKTTLSLKTLILFKV